MLCLTHVYSEGLLYFGHDNHMIQLHFILLITWPAKANQTAGFRCVLRVVALKECLFHFYHWRSGIGSVVLEFWAVVLSSSSSLGINDPIIHCGITFEDLYLVETEVSSSEGWRILQVVKVYVELVWDIHFPGKWTTKEEKEKSGVRGKKSSRQNCRKMIMHESPKKTPAFISYLAHIQVHN